MSKKVMSKKNVLAGAALLTAAGVKAEANDACVQEVNTGGLVGSKLSLGYNHLTLDESPAQNVTVCTPNNDIWDTKTGRTQTMPDEMSVAVQLGQTHTTQLRFTIGDIVPEDNDRYLFLLAGTSRLPSPSFDSTRSVYKFCLGGQVEWLAWYDIPKRTISEQEETAFLARTVNSIGMADYNQADKVVVKFNFENAKLSTFLASGESTLYVQAGLIDKKEWDDAMAGKGINIDSLIFSEIDKITLMNGSCPDGYTAQTADDDGLLSSSSAPTKSGGDTSGDTGATK
ncbi:hypothetical protein [Candidatus Venteria ishoeyi]|uniref:Uncharacterized protein n=1 Tax=Candidatus Venteria ishoeyi TaxID=1899563 RepID=A0A1H6F7I1_9GAMM|nr:hypothetical protein [Candidatus Venteria ishoeyi]SEH05026.1 Uncharacterised protein [Candidatus Venteria ishoeyi]